MHSAHFLWTQSVGQCFWNSNILSIPSHNFLHSCFWWFTIKHFLSFLYNFRCLLLWYVIKYYQLYLLSQSIRHEWRGCSWNVNRLARIKMLAYINTISKDPLLQINLIREEVKDQRYQSLYPKHLWTKGHWSSLSQVE